MSSSITQKTLLATLVLLCCSNVYAAASTGVYMPRTHYDDRCYADVPPYVKNPKDQNLNGSVVSITADSVDAELNSDINYSGNVEIIQGLICVRIQFRRDASVQCRRQAGKGH